MRIAFLAPSICLVATLAGARPALADEPSPLPPDILSLAEYSQVPFEKGTPMHEELLKAGDDIDKAKAALCAPLARLGGLALIYQMDMAAEFKAIRKRLSPKKARQYAKVLQGNEIALKSIQTQLDRIQAWKPGTKGRAKDGMKDVPFVTIPANG